MDDFRIPPEYCVIVKAFSQTKSLRQAAALLGCDAGSLARKARKIADDYRLLEKIRGRWSLTETGRKMCHWTDESIASQKHLLNEQPRRRITSSAWLAEQILIPALGRLNLATDDAFVWTLNTTSLDLESELLNSKTDYVVASRPPMDPSIAHRRTVPEKWIVIVPAAWREIVKRLAQTDLIEFLRGQPFVRHALINPDAILGFSLPNVKNQPQVNSLISVRAGVEAGYGWSCVPEALVRNSLRENKLLEAPFPVLTESELCLWWLRSRKDVEKNVKTLAAWLSAAYRADSDQHAERVRSTALSPTTCASSPARP